MEIKKTIAFIIGLILIFSISFCFLLKDGQKEYAPLTKEQRFILLKYGMDKIDVVRYPTDVDINMGISVSDGVNNFKVYESRNFKKGDYGKLFASPI